MDYTTPQKAKPLTASLDRFKVVSNNRGLPTHEGVEVVEYFQKYIDIPMKGKFGFSFHLGKIKACGIKTYHAEKIIEIMKARKAWVKAMYGEELECGKWLTNRYKEIQKIGPEKFLSKNT